MFNTLPRVVAMTTNGHVKHLVIGAGFAGLGTAIKLDEDGETDFLVIEKGHDVGGTWRDNTYPGAACDVPSQLYSFSFAPNPDWSSSFSPQPEIHAYLRTVAARSGVLDRFRFGTTVEHAAWDEERQHWRVRLSAGGEVTATIAHLRLPAGSRSRGCPTSTASTPSRARCSTPPAGTTTWTCAGKRVAVIGTGASSIQIVPEVAKVAAHLDVYQRTAPYVIPRGDRPYTRLERLAFRHLPLVQRAYRTGIYWGREALVPGFTVNPRLAAPAKRLALANIRKGISDPALREAVTPDFEIGCKRILISNDYYPALDADHVDLVTDGIAKVTGDAIVTADGTEHPIDVLVVATGFFTTEQPIAEHIVGREGRSLAEVWRETGMAGYKGTTVHGFPNYFSIVGPNTGLGHSSMVFMIEAQIDYIRDAVRTMETNAYATVEPRREAQDAWNDDLQRRMRRTVWSTGGCSSWYLDEHGRNTTLWPRTTYTFRNLLSRFDVAAYDVTAAHPHERR